MYVGTLFVYTIILVLLSPVIWVAWWLVADLGEKVSGSAAETHQIWDERLHRAA